MKKNITMSDIAERLNISTVTVSKALSNKDGVSESLREEIKKVADEMGYRCNIAAKGMKEGCTYNIGVITAERYMMSGNSFYWMMYQKIIQNLSLYNYYAILEIISKETELENKLPNMVQDRRIDALIVLGQVRENYIDLISEQNIPIIFLDFYDRHFDMDAVIGDNMYGAYIITNYLVSKGHKEIGYVGNIYATSSILDRYLGYSKTLIEHRIPIRQEWTISDRDSDGVFCEFDLPDKLPTAFVCNCDEVAYHFIQYLNKKGIRVPEDVSVVGFDDYLYATISSPQITTIQVDVENMAKEAVEGIFKKIEDSNYKLGRKVITGKIILRESVRSLC